MSDLATDLRYGLRSLLGRPALTIAATVTLALGIGVTTSIFSVVYGVLLRPLPFEHEDRLVTFCEQFPGVPNGACIASPPNLEDIAAQSRSIEAVGMARSWSVRFDTPDGPEEMAGGIATPGFFHAFDVRPEAGRLLAATDLVGDAGSVALITHDLWQSRFGGRRDIVGKIVPMDGRSVTIVGVLPRSFAPPRLEWIQVWRPLHIDPRDEAHRDWRGFRSFGRLRDGVSFEQAQSELAALAATLHQEHFSKTPGWDIRMRSLHEYVVSGPRPMLLLFLGAVLLVLLIGCANVANLLLGRAAARGREMALRAALGASRGRIVRALLVESLLLALAGGGAGVLLAVWMTELFKMLAPPGIPRIAEVAVDARVLFFALGLSLCTAMLFGLAPALRASRVNLAQALREGSRTGTHHIGRLGAMLVVAEIALAVTIVSGAGVLTRSFVALDGWSPGFDYEHLVAFNLFGAPTKYPDKRAVASLWDRIEGELRAIPGVTSVGSASAGPLFGGNENSEMHMEGAAAGQRAPVRWYDVSPRFFATLGVPLLRGRGIGAQDVAGALPVALANETLASRFWPRGDALGKHITRQDEDGEHTYEIVGIVRDISPVKAGDPVEPELYWSNRQEPRLFSYFVIRTGLPAAEVMPIVRLRLKTVDKSLTPGDVATLTERLDLELKRPRFNMTLLIAFGVSALLLAAVGTQGVLAYAVVQRTREIGVRLALGAGRGEVLMAIVKQGLSLVVIGVGIGTLLSLAMARAVATLVVGVSPRDPLTLAVAAATVILVGLASSILPALRASRVDPAIALAAD